MSSITPDSLLDGLEDPGMSWQREGDHAITDYCGVIFRLHRRGQMAFFDDNKNSWMTVDLAGRHRRRIRQFYRRHLGA